MKEIHGKMAVLPTDATGQPMGMCPEWNYRQLWLALFFSLVLQFVFIFPIMSSDTPPKVAFALAFDLFMLLRILTAKLQHCHGRGWIFYLLLMYTSPAWITGLGDLYFTFF